MIRFCLLLVFLFCCSVAATAYDSLHIRGIGKVELARRSGKCRLIAASVPLSASCIDDSGDVAWNTVLRKNGTVHSFSADEKLAIVISNDEHGTGYVTAILISSGAFLWDMPFPQEPFATSAITIMSEANTASVITKQQIILFENIFSAAPVVQSSSLSSGCELAVPATKGLLYDCVSLNSGMALSYSYDAVNKFTFNRGFRSILTSSFSPDSTLRLEHYQEGSVVNTHDFDMKEFINPHDHHVSIEESDFFYETQAGISIPSLYIKLICGQSKKRIVHLVFQIESSEQKLVSSFFTGKGKFVKSFHPSRGNEVQAFYIVELKHSTDNSWQGQLTHETNGIEVFSIHIPHVLSVEALNLVDLSGTKSKIREVLGIMENGFSFSLRLQANVAVYNPLNWLRNDALSRLKDLQLLNLSPITKIFDFGQEVVGTRDSLTEIHNIMAFFAAETDSSSCSLTGAVLAYSKNEKDRSLQSSGLLAHLISVRSPKCGKLSVVSFQPVLPHDIVVKSVTLIPRWDAHYGTAPRVHAQGFYLAVESLSEIYFWSYDFTAIASLPQSFDVSTSSYTNRVIELPVTEKISTDGGMTSLISTPQQLLLFSQESRQLSFVKPSTEHPLSDDLRNFFHIHRASGTVYFEKVDVSNSCRSSERSCYLTTTISSIVFDPAVEELVLVLRPNSPLHRLNRATTLGDDNILLNYINPNIGVICTRGIADSEQSSLTINIIDVVSGKILHRVVQESAMMPINGLILENFVLVSYWNSKAKRGEVVCIGLYDGFIGKSDFTPFGMESRAAKVDETHSFYKAPNVTKHSSFFTTAPLLMQRTYSFQRGIVGLCAAVSSRSINNKNIILAFDSGQISSIDFRALSPRRPLSDPTQSEKEEGLFRYNPFITILPTSTLTRNKKLSFIKNIDILSAPSHLESQSTVIAAGNGGDLYISVYTPAQAFDALAPDFNHLALIALLVGLFVTVLFLRQMNRRTTLNRLWQ